MNRDHAYTRNAHTFSDPIRRNDHSTLALIGRWSVFLIPIILCVTLVIQTFRERQSMLALANAAEAATQQLQLENQRLQEEIKALRENADVIERTAREELNMLRPDEIIISSPHQSQEADQLKPTPAVSPSQRPRETETPSPPKPDSTQPTIGQN